jgi:hypothetical protein
MAITIDSFHDLNQHTVAVAIKAYLLATDHEDVFLELRNQYHFFLLLILAELLPAIANVFAPDQTNRIRQGHHMPEINVSEHIKGLVAREISDIP